MFLVFLDLTFSWSPVSEMSMRLVGAAASTTPLVTTGGCGLGLVGTGTGATWVTLSLYSLYMYVCNLIPTAQGVVHGNDTEKVTPNRDKRRSQEKVSRLKHPTLILNYHSLKFIDDESHLFLIKPEHKNSLQEPYFNARMSGHSRSCCCSAAPRADPRAATGISCCPSCTGCTGSTVDGSCGVRLS